MTNFSTWQNSSMFVLFIALLLSSINCYAIELSPDGKTIVVEGDTTLTFKAPSKDTQEYTCISEFRNNNSDRSGPRSNSDHYLTVLEPGKKAYDISMHKIFTIKTNKAFSLKFYNASTSYGRYFFEVSCRNSKVTSLKGAPNSFALLEPGVPNTIEFDGLWDKPSPFYIHCFFYYEDNEKDENFNIYSELSRQDESYIYTKNINVQKNQEWAYSFGNLYTLSKDENNKAHLMFINLDTKERYAYCYIGLEKDFNYPNSV